MKIFGKRLGKFLNLVVNGKPKTIETKSEDEMNELISVVQKASKGDEKSIEELKEKTQLKDYSTLFPELSKLEESVNEAESKVVAQEQQLKSIDEEYTVLSNSPHFDVKDKRVYLKDSKSEIPYVLVNQIANNIKQNKDISKYLNFWKLTLLNPNPEARRGLYRFIQNQKLYLHESGFFIAFRRIVKVTTTTQQPYSENNVVSPTISSLIEKIKKSKKAIKNYYLYLDNKTQQLVTKHKDSKVSDNLQLLTRDLYSYKSDDGVAQNSIDNRQLYTDNYTKTMKIYIGESVSIPREACDSRGGVSCSRGLHVGSKSFVESNDDFGHVIVACLINPQNVVSVPYLDAHKMRVCEYFPFTTLTDAELRDFDLKNVDEFVNKYRVEHDQKLEDALNIIDNLTNNEYQQFATDDYIEEDQVEKNNNKLLIERQEFEKEKKKIEVLLKDNISDALDLNEIRMILSMRKTNKV